MNKKFFGDYQQPDLPSPEQTKLNHVAGPMDNGIQRCTRCGKVLIDARAAAKKGGTPPKGFNEGQPVTVEGSKIIGAKDPAAPDCAQPIGS